MKICKHTCVRY